MRTIMPVRTQKGTTECGLSHALTKPLIWRLPERARKPAHTPGRQQAARRRTPEMSFDSEPDELVDALQTHNPWWTDGATALGPELPARPRSDYYHLARPEEPGSQFEDQPLLGLVGRRGVGKTTLLKQFIYKRIADGDAPERFCYLPFDSNPLYQLASDEQLHQAIRYYESRVLGRLDDPDPHFLLLDDVHRVEHQHKRDIDGWGTPVAQALGQGEGRHVVVTASAGIQVTRELDRVDVPDETHDTQPILPEKFRDYLFTLYQSLEHESRRVSPTPLRQGEGSLPHALDADDPNRLIETVRAQRERVDDVTGRIRSQVAHYLAMGGIISYAGDGAVEDATTLGTAPYERLRTDLREALYREVPQFESVKTIADLERLCALAARNAGAEPIRYQRLVELFDVDRRTVRDSYFDALSKLYLLTPSTEYDNARPRSVRLYLRDTGLMTTFAENEPAAVLRDRGQEAALAQVAAYDHTMRFAYGVNAIQGHDVDPDVSYWNTRQGVVDFVFEVGDTPVPVALAYRPPVDESRAALTAFLDQYDTPLGILLVGDTVRGSDEVQLLDDRIIQLPYWLYMLLC